MSTEWKQFEQVTQYVLAGHKLYRSSAPNYAGNDQSQRLTATAVAFLTGKGINSIISFNEYSYTNTEIALLNGAHISYLHLSVVDFHAPTMDQLLQAIKFYNVSTNSSTLVHCGYGHGRTGTGITALQLSVTRGKNPVEADWTNVNHVEEAAQITVLKQLRDSYLNGEL